MLEFGTVSNLNADLAATVGTRGLSVVCSPNTVASLTLNAGTNGTSSLRHLSNGATTNPTFITYRLYSDVGHNSEIAINTPITLPTGTGATQPLPFTARINASQANKPAGSYKDTVTVAVTINYPPFCTTPEGEKTKGESAPQFPAWSTGAGTG